MGTYSALPRLARMEWRMSLRTGAFRLTALCAFLAGLGTGSAPGVGTGMSAYATGEAACVYLALVAVAWSSVAAVRESSLRTDVLVSSKPQSNEMLILLRFLGAFFPILALLSALFLGAVVGRLFDGGLIGADAYLLQVARAAAVLFVASAAAFTLAVLSNSPLGGALIGLYWILSAAAKEHLAKVFFPMYSQNIPAFVCLGVGLLCLAMWLNRRRRRGAAPAATWVRIGAIGGLILTAWLTWTLVRDGHDPQTLRNPAMERMGSQDVPTDGPAAGFTLPDGRGRQTGLADFAGRILVIGLFTPHDDDSTALLDQMNDMQKRYGPRGVQAIAICVSQDEMAALTFARGERLLFPVLTDWGTYNAPIRAQASPLAGAFRADFLPHVAVTDRRRRVRGTLSAAPGIEPAALDSLVEERLDAEPR